MSAKHTHDQICPSCEEKLKQAHPYLVSWFHKVKDRHGDVHISWSYRDQAAQEQAFIEGKTHAHYPDSPHNKRLPDGTPQSLALDLFQLGDDGKAAWFEPFFRGIWNECLSDQDEITWGGLFRSLGDLDHYQVNPNART